MNSNAIPKIINVIDKPVLKREFMLEASVAVTTSQCCATDTMQKTAKITSAAIKYLEIFLIFYLLKNHLCRLLSIATAHIKPIIAIMITMIAIVPPTFITGSRTV